MLQLYLRVSSFLPSIHVEALFARAKVLVVVGKGGKRGSDHTCLAEGEEGLFSVVAFWASV